MRASRGFTLLEMMVVVAVIAIVGSLVVYQGLSARQAATIAGGAYDLALRLGGLKARAMAEGQEYLLVVTDTADAAGCRDQQTKCGRVLVLRKPDAALALAGFTPDPPITGAEWVGDEGGIGYLPRGTQFDLASTWRPPVPFDAITAFDSTVLATCAGGRACFGIRFRPDGEVRPVLPAGTSPPGPGGFAFVLRPLDLSSRAAERRGLFISFPAGLVKTAAF